MTGAILHQTPLVECGAALTPIPGETESGDRCLVLPTSGGVLVAVVDGLGHGAEAARAAEAAVATLEANPEEPVAGLMRECHLKMLGTRGAAMSVAHFCAHDNTLTWLGVGNVDGVLLRVTASTELPDESLLLRPGVVGYNLPLLRPLTLSVSAGDLLIFATDGIRPDFAAQLSLRDAPQRLADKICATYSKRNDDALVLVVRYTGEWP